MLWIWWSASLHAINCSIRMASWSGLRAGNDSDVSPDDNVLAAQGISCLCGGSDLEGKQKRRPEQQRMTTASKEKPVLKSLYGLLCVPTLSERGEGRCPRGSNEQVHPGDCRGRGPGIRRKIHRDNVGKVLLPAGADSNLHRPAAQGYKLRPWEGEGLAHELVVAMTDG